MEAEKGNSNRGREMYGKVVSVKMNRTVIVAVQQMWKHPKYGKTIRKTRSFAADNEKIDLRLGDEVIMTESRPISRTKHFRVIKKIEK
jgi:small subunit ribosomal protein S17